MAEKPTEGTRQENDDRREFLKACGRFAAITPPAITMLLSTSLTSKCDRCIRGWWWRGQA